MTAENFNCHLASTTIVAQTYSEEKRTSAMDSDCRQILRELEALFSRDEELQEIADINKMAREIAVQSANAVADSQEEVKSKIGNLLYIFFVFSGFIRVDRCNKREGSRDNGTT